MKRTYDANIGGTIFHVEEDAYRRLERYLESVQAHFRSYPERDDIVADIESRIAEQFAQRSGHAHVVMLTDVEAIIGVMGSVEQFGDAVAPAAAPEPAPAGADAIPPSGRRWFRDPDTRVIAGVAAGLARWFGIGPRWVRLAFAAPILFMVFVAATDMAYVQSDAIARLGLLEGLVYVGLWLIMPSKKTAPDVAEASAPGPRRLYRDPDDMRIAGVAAGLARYLGVAPRTMRLAFLLLVPLLVVLSAAYAPYASFESDDIVVFGLLEAAAYLLLWLLIPRAKTSIDKLRMRGHAVTLASVAQQVREEDIVQTSRSAAATLMGAIGLSVRMLVLGTVWVTAGLLAVWTLIATIGLTVLLTVVMTNPALIHVTRALAASTAMGFKFYPFVVCCYLLAVIPLILIGTTLIAELQRRRGVSWRRPAPGVYVTAVAAWMVALIAWAWLWASSAKPADLGGPLVDAPDCQMIYHPSHQTVGDDSAAGADTANTVTVTIEQRCGAW